MPFWRRPWFELKVLAVWLFLIWERIGIARDVGSGVQDNNFTVTGAKAVGDDIDVAELIDICLAENERRMGAYDRRLLRPFAVPALAKLARRFMRSGPKSARPALKSGMKLRIVLIAALGAALAVYLVAFVGIGAVFSAADCPRLGWLRHSLPVYAGGVPGLGDGLACLAAGLRPQLVGFRVGAHGARCSHRGAAILTVRRHRFRRAGGDHPGRGAAVAFASTVVDVTTELMAQIVFVALGLGILSLQAPHTSFAASLSRALGIGLAVAVVACGAFLALQRRSLWLTGKTCHAPAPRCGRGECRRRRHLHRHSSFSAAHRSVVCPAPGRMGCERRRNLDCVSLDWRAHRPAARRGDRGLVCAARSAAVFVPNALGVQEAAYAVLAPLFGVGAEFGLAVSLLKRARDIALGVPILLIWHAAEGQRALAKSPRL